MLRRVSRSWKNADPTAAQNGAVNAIDGQHGAIAALEVTEQRAQRLAIVAAGLDRGNVRGRPEAHLDVGERHRFGPAHVQLAHEKHDAPEFENRRNGEPAELHQSLYGPGWRSADRHGESRRAAKRRGHVLRDGARDRIVGEPCRML